MPGLVTDALRCVVNGNIGSVQTWSTSIWVSLGAMGGPLTQAQINTLASQVATPTQTWLSNLASAGIWSADTTVSNLTCYWYPALSTKSALVSTPQTMTGSGSSSVYQPSYVSMVVSLRSDTPGRSGRGRLYIPCTATTLSSGHKFTSGPATNVGTFTQTYLKAVNLLTFALPANNNKVNVASFSKGLQYTVTSISVDDNPDTQHRRIDKIGRVKLFAGTI